jgi:hypothetical protein
MPYLCKAFQREIFPTIMRLYAALLTITVCLLPFLANATSQISDWIIVGKDTTFTNCTPLEPYLDKKGSRNIGGVFFEEEGSCTGLWRGYVATWKLEHDSLFLIRVQINYCTREHRKDLDLQKEFGTKRVFANWVTDTIDGGLGRILQYGSLAMVFGPIYEGDAKYAIRRGHLQHIQRKKYLRWNAKAVYPNEAQLKDTFMKLILRRFDQNDRNILPDSDYCVLRISFDAGTRRVNKITVRPQTLHGDGEPKTILEKMVVQEAQIALKDFPPLMKVTHGLYEMPTISIYFFSTCLKQPKEKRKCKPAS